ncbi:MAG TPA: hypothetical protein IAC80_06150 [Candidatus Merdiplasma excrementigallinarum]|uniref:Uncharacterized protein n=1 Tax=Candidatus Merdiplasma excrementigallinarum TaxID=2840864 RepID=A0A9D1NZ55_9FIRM|nr:hypothetical protein [Candidatus Merdiplasma excrementigallinarum]
MKNELKGSTAVSAAKKTAAAETPVEKTVSAKQDKKTVKAAEVKTAEKEVKAAKTAEKEVKEVKPAKPAAKAPAKKAAVKETIYLQYLGKEIDKEDLMKQVKEIWTKEQKRKVSDMKSVSLYLKPEENAAYYVINEEVSGKIDL